MQDLVSWGVSQLRFGLTVEYHNEEVSDSWLEMNQPGEWGKNVACKWSKLQHDFKKRKLDHISLNESQNFQKWKAQKFC